MVVSIRGRVSGNRACAAARLLAKFGGRGEGAAACRNAISRRAWGGLRGVGGLTCCWPRGRGKRVSRSGVTTLSMPSSFLRLNPGASCSRNSRPQQLLLQSGRTRARPHRSGAVLLLPMTAAADDIAPLLRPTGLCRRVQRPQWVSRVPVCRSEIAALTAGSEALAIRQRHGHMARESTLFPREGGA